MKSEWTGVLAAPSHHDFLVRGGTGADCEHKPRKQPQREQRRGWLLRDIWLHTHMLAIKYIKFQNGFKMAWCSN